MNLIESQFVLRESEHRGETEEGYECSMKSSQRFQLNTSSCWR